MARHARRLILWVLSGFAALLVLALVAGVVLVLWVNPNVYRKRIEVAASAALGRQVLLSGDLRWRLRSRIFIESADGALANAPGFGDQPLARWSQLRFGLAARPLLRRRVVVDRIEVDGLQLQLQRNAQGQGNWMLAPASGGAAPADDSVAVKVGSIAFGNSSLRFQDAAAGADWRFTGMSFSVDLPEDLSAEQREFRQLKLNGLLAGGPLASEGVALLLRAELLRVAMPKQGEFAASVVDVPAFAMQWGDATLEGGLHARMGESPEAQGTFELKVPALRKLLATVQVPPPPMQDPTTLGALQFSTQIEFKRGALALNTLELSLDDTQITGVASVVLKPVALRFDLSANQINLDRYMEPDNIKSEPFELPLARLKALDAKGVLRVKTATVAGARAQDLRIDVE